MTSIAEFDELCIALGEKNRAYKTLEKEVKELRAKVLDELMLRDEDSRSYKVAGSTFYIRQMAIVTVPKQMSEKEKLFKYLRKSYPDWFKSSLTINHRSLASMYQQEADICAQEGREYDGLPGAIIEIKDTLGIRG